MIIPEVRYDPATGSVAVRTVHPADAWNAWGVMTTDRGGRLTSEARVADWIAVPIEPPVADEG